MDDLSLLLTFISGLLGVFLGFLAQRALKRYELSELEQDVNALYDRIAHMEGMVGKQAGMEKRAAMQEESTALMAEFMQLAQKEGGLSKENLAQLALKYPNAARKLAKELGIPIPF